MIQYADAADGCRLAWSRDGLPGAPALLLFNSIGTDLTLWEPQLSELGCRFDVIRFDTRGHGRSDAPDDAYTLQTLAADAVSVLDAAGIGQAHVCGLSLGGAVALQLALDSPLRVDRLIIANSAARIGSAEAWQARMDTVLSKGLEAIADMAMARFFDKGFRSMHPDVVDRFRTMLLANPAHGYAGCCAALRDADLTRHLSRLQSRTLVIAGSKDLSTPPPQLHALAEVLPEARIVELDAAHLSNVEAAEAFTRAVQGFLLEA